MMMITSKKHRSRSLLIVAALSLAAIASVTTIAGCSDDTATPVQTTDAGNGSDAADATSSNDVVVPPAKDASKDAPAEGAPPDNGPIVGPRDRVGRAYVSLLLVSTANREDYNADDVFFVATTDPNVDGGTSFGQDFQAALVALDLLDGVVDWNGGSGDAGADDAGTFPHELVNAWLLADALVVDPNKPFSTTSYLDIEAHGDAHTTCGGRWPGDDALDKTMSFLVKKSLSGIGDGVAAPAKAPSQTFPYLAEPF